MVDLDPGRWAEAVASGWHIFPLTPGGKTPATGASWPRIATTDHLEAGRWPANANVGGACKAASRLVIDLDGQRLGHKDGGLAILNTGLTRAGHPALPRTRTHITRNGGTHLVYTLSAEQLPRLGNHRGELGRIAVEAGLEVDGHPLLDIRGGGDRGGGYVVLPGSWIAPDDHASLGADGHVRIACGAPAVALPGWLERLLLPRQITKPPPGAAFLGALPPDPDHAAELADRIRNAPEGSGNETLNTVAFELGGMVRHGQLSHSEAEKHIDQALSCWTYRNHEDERKQRETAKRALSSGALSGRAWDPPTARQPTIRTDHDELAIGGYTAAAPDEGGTEATRQCRAPAAYPAASAGTLLGAVLAAAGSIDHAIVGGFAAALVSALIPQVRLARPGGAWSRGACWIVPIAPPGAGKTPALAALQRALNTRDEAVAAEWSTKKQEWDGTRQGDRLGMEDPGPLPAVRVLRNVTPEALLQKLAKDPIGGVAVLRDELAAVMKGIGQYKQGGNDKDVILEMWSGQTNDSATIGRGYLLAKDPYLVIAGGLQPDPRRVDSVLGTPEDGYAARWLPHPALPDAEADERNPMTVPAQWHEMVGTLHDYSGKERTWMLDQEGAALINTADAVWKVERKDANEHLSAFLAKAREHALRLALVFAEMEGAKTLEQRVTSGHAHPWPLPHKALIHAINVTNYSATYWRGRTRIEAVNNPRNTEHVRHLLDRVCTRANELGGAVPQREVMRLTRLRACQLPALAAEFEALGGAIASTVRGGQRTADWVWNNGDEY